MRKSSLWLMILALAAAAAGCGEEATKQTTDAASADTVSDVSGSDAVDDASDVTESTDAAGDTTPTLTSGIWTQLTLPAGNAGTGGNTSLHGVWTDGPTRAVIAGSAGSIYTYDGLGWKVASQNQFPTLHSVSGGPHSVEATGTGSAGRTFAVGMGGTIVQSEGSGGKVGTVWGPPGGCVKSSECNDFDPCTADACESGVCSHQPSGAAGCCGGVAFADSFDKGLSQWTVTDLQTSAGQGGILWTAAAMTGKDGGKRATSPPKAAYFGRTDALCDDGKTICPSFDNGLAVGAAMTSPYFVVPKAQQVTLSFQLLLDVDAGYFDQLQVWVLHEGGAKEKVWDKYTQLKSGSTGGKFTAQTVDLTGYATQKIRLEVVFNSLDKNNNGGEGAFIDDLVVSSTCAPPASSAKALTSGTLFSVWAADSADAWTVGEAGFTAHWDGQAWTQVSGTGNTGKARDLYGIAGSGSAGVIVGDQGYAASVIGGGVKALPTGTTNQLRAAAVRTSDDGKTLVEAMAVGAMGTVLHWQDGAWAKEPAGAMLGQDLRGVTALPAGLWAAVSSGGAIFERDGAGKWSQVSTVGMPLRAVTTVGASSAVAVGQFGALAERKSGSWVIGNLTGGGTANAVWGDADGNAWAVGENGMAWVRGTDGAWAQQPTSTSVHLNGVWAANPNDVFACGLLSTIVHFDGTEWSAMNTPAGVDWQGIWGTANNDVYAVGTTGAVAHWNGEDWTLLVQPVKETLRHVWGLNGGDVWAVGEKGAIYHSTGLGWQATPITPWQPDPDQKPYKVKSTLLAVWGAKTDDVWASGEPDQDGHGIVVHWDGAEWTFIPLLWENGKTIRTMWGWGADRILMAGTQGTVLQLDGTQQSLQPLKSGTIATLFGIAPFGKDALLVGDIGVVLRYTPPTKLTP